jgi:hypothetical protein
MSRPHRVRVPALISATSLLLAGSLTGFGAGAAHATGGAYGKRVSLQSGISLSGYDAATTQDGTTYVGWIASVYNDPALRQVHLCVLHPGSRSCVGGVQTTGSLAPSAAQDLHVVVAKGQVELVWDAQATLGSGDFSGIFGVARVVGGHLQPATAVPGAPTYPTTTSVIATKSGDVSAAVIGAGSNDNKVYYYKTLTSTPKTLTRHYFIGNAQLADNGHQTVLTTSAYGSLSGRVSVAHKPSSASSWSGFSTVKHSYTGGNVEKLQTAHGKIYLLGMSDKALYTQYLYRWKGASFAGPVSTGDHQGISSFDPTTDASGRLASVSAQVGNFAVSNFGHGSGKAAEFHVKVKQTFAGGPVQITTSPSGRGWLVYAVETTASTGDLMYAQPIRLGGLTKKVHKHGRAGVVTVKGPVSCLPVSKVHVSVTGKPHHGWKVASKKLRLGSKKQRGTLNGGGLRAHHAYTLKGTVVFHKGHSRSAITAKLRFTTCGRP